MVWGGEFGSNTQQRFSQEDLVIGCLVDLATGLMNFTANGKEINTFYQVSKGHLFKGGTVVSLKNSPASVRSAFSSFELISIHNAFSGGAQH